MKVINVVGARPNFMKIAPIIEELENYPSIEPILVHTGQHYSPEMSDLFFRDLGLPEPDIYLGVGSSSHAEQTAKIILEFEKVIVDIKPNLVVVVGDVNSTLAAALVGAKLQIPIAHIEAGLRSFDRSMPEEINRVLTDAVSDYLFLTEPSAQKNLLNEGIAENKMFLVGNVMVDTLLKHQNKAKESEILENLKLLPKEYALLTLHRPSNVDTVDALNTIFTILENIQKDIIVVYPIHPRAEKNIIEFGLEQKIKKLQNLKLVKPLGYLDFLKLMMYAKFVLTDSGGIQEETTVLGIPCLTLRNNTERPITVAQGSNTVVGTDIELIDREVKKILKGNGKKGKIPYLWDGKAAERIVDILNKKYVYV